MKHLLLRHMYNLLLPNLCAMHSSLRALRLPTVDPYSAVVPGGMLAGKCTHTVLCDAYIVACVDTSRMVLLGPFSPQIAGESFDTCSKAAKLILVDTQVF